MSQENDNLIVLRPAIRLGLALGLGLVMLLGLLVALPALETLAAIPTGTYSADVVVTQPQPSGSPTAHNLQANSEQCIQVHSQRVIVDDRDVRTVRVARGQLRGQPVVLLHEHQPTNCRREKIAELTVAGPYLEHRVSRLSRQFRH